MQLVATVALFYADLDLTLIVGVLLLQMVLVLVISDVGRNEQVPEGTERVWRLAILLAGPLAEPVYYWHLFLGSGA